eukprot:CAMPEP_0113880630 /NCGR_PEP_ID=MMETSP0780_2-20120614/7897_1 /TAXON_ID=652834 /ORGANISM="Palpitomonas bilix" /LENGTH=290 /DNA_ID=CAMNT_0000867337 /DNA_START=344 /DNA_END=1216 /DNA_ORIENTATION=- /assembly_acc=CAM_ASM_000599
MSAQEMHSSTSHFAASAIAGGSSGGLRVLLSYPLDLVKTRQQVQSHSSWKGAFRSVYNVEGLRGMYRGVSAPLVWLGFQKSVSFSAYEASSAFFKKNNPTLAGATFFSGAFSGAVNSILSCPSEVLKVRSQMFSALVEQSSAAPARSGRLANVFRLTGVRGLFTGTGAMVAKDSLGMGLFFSMYESFKQASASRQDGSVSLSSRVLSGGTAGILAISVTFPLDVIKARWMSQFGNGMKYKNYADCVVKTVAEKGVRGMYRGLAPICIRTFPIHGIAIAAYDILSDYLKSA